jgi:hypothetical protein
MNGGPFELSNKKNDKTGGLTEMFLGPGTTAGGPDVLPNPMPEPDPEPPKPDPTPEPSPIPPVPEPAPAFTGFTLCAPWRKFPALRLV